VQRSQATIGADASELELTLPRERVTESEWLEQAPAPTAERKQLSFGPRAERGGTLARWIAIAALAALLLVIVGYVGVTAFYVVSKSWLVPTVVSATDEKVVALQNELAIQQAEQQRLAKTLADGDSLSDDVRAALRASLARQDKIVANLQGSAYLRALTDNTTVALVPQENLDHVKPGTALYACRLEMFWCHNVGRVSGVLPGEIQFRHPNRDTQVRGRMIEMQLDDLAAARADVLFADGKPLGL